MSVQVQQLREALAERYELVQEVGRGARAVVYLARDLKHDRPVAIKALLPEFSASIGAERFLKEIGIAAKMTHPHILPLFDSGQTEGGPFYITPYVEGQSLRDRIRVAGRLPVSDAVNLACQVADALEYAHKKGVVHRDIKPENILLEEGKAVVADFGIARALTVAGADTLTATGMALGTPQYMAPEQAAGEQDIDGRTDLYALGCVLFEMLAGEPPFRGPTARTVIAQQLSQPPPSLLALRPEIPIWLDRAVLRLLAKDPEDRFETAGRLTAELAVHSGSGLDAVSGSWARWLYRLRRKRRPVLAVALSLGLAVVGAVYLFLLPGLGPRTAQHDPAPLTSLAIVPLQDLSEADHAYLAKGLADHLTHHLGSLQPLTVVSAATMREYARTGLPLDSVVARHGVGTIIGGTLLATDREIQVLMELTDAVTGIRFAGTGPLRRPRGELPLLLEELTDDVARLLRRRLGGELALRSLAAATECSECLDLLFRAREMQGQANSLIRAGDVEEARRTLSRADSILVSVELLDPDWMEPVLERAWIETIRARRFTSRPGSYDVVACSEGLDHVQRVLNREPSNAAALELRGMFRYYLAEDAEDPAERPRLWLAAQEDLERAVQMDRSAAMAWSTLSQIHYDDGRLEQAKQAAENGLAADAWLFNDSNLMIHLCQVSLELGELEEAEHWCLDEGRRRFPDRPGFVSAELILLTFWEEWAPDGDRAWALADTLVQLFAPHRQEAVRPGVWMDVASVLARSGRPDSARAVIQGARAMAPSEDPVLDYREAHARLKLGEREEALRLLESYLAARPDRRARIARDSWFKPLRQDSTFQRLVAVPAG